MKNPTPLPFSLRLFTTLITIICFSIPFFSHAHTFLAKRAAEGNMILLPVGKIVNLFGIDNPGTKQSQKPVKDYGKENSSFSKKIVEEV